jgi:mRNA interferase MazF
MRRGEIYITQTARKRRPVVVATRDSILRYLENVVVVPCTTTVRGLDSEVPISAAQHGVDQDSVANCDWIVTLPKSDLGEPVGRLDPESLRAFDKALAFALGLGPPPGLERPT